MIRILVSHAGFPRDAPKRAPPEVQGALSAGAGWGSIEYWNLPLANALLAPSYRLPTRTRPGRRLRQT